MKQRPPKFESIASFWTSYQSQVIPKDAPPVQIQESRRAFYAGCQAMFAGMVEAVGGPEVPEEIGEIYLQAIDAELKGFVAEVKAGRA